METRDGQYVIDPRQAYLCPYCNKGARLIDANVVIDSHKNPCHIECFDAEVAPASSGGKR